MVHAEDPSGEGGSAVRLECRVQLVVEEAEARGRAGGEFGGGGREASGTGGTSRSDSGAGAPQQLGCQAAEAAAKGRADDTGVDVAAAAVPVHGAGGEEGGEGGDESDDTGQGGEGGGEGAGATGGEAVEAQPPSSGVGGGEGADGAAASGGSAVVEAAEGGKGEQAAPWRPSRDGAGDKVAVRHREPYRRVSRGHLREGVCVYVGGVRAHANDAVLRASMQLLHDVLHAPDLFLYVVVVYSNVVRDRLRL